MTSSHQGSLSSREKLFHFHEKFISMRAFETGFDQYPGRPFYDYLPMESIDCRLLIRLQ